MQRFTLLVVIACLCACSDHGQAPTAASVTQSSAVSAPSDKMYECPGEVQGSVHCDLKIEAGIALRYPGRIQRDGRMLTVTLESGKSVQLFDDDAKNKAATHALVEYFPEVGYAVIAFYLDTGKTYGVLNMQTGEITHVVGKVLMSPDKRRFAAYMADIDAGDIENVLAVYLITPEALIAEYQIHPNDWGVDDLKWESEKAILYGHVNKDSQGNTEKTFFNLQLVNEDDAGVGEWENSDKEAPPSISSRTVLASEMPAIKKVNEQEALADLIDAANSGDAVKQERLGDAYFAGKGTPKDYAKALAWYKKAADQSIPSSQKKVGIMYDLGYGVDRDRAEAEKWYALSKQALANREHK
jgi:hypothetical protein